MATKMTKKDYFTALLALLANTDTTDINDDISVDALTAFVNHEIELLENKRSSVKPTKAQTENIAVKETIVLVLKEIGKPVTITEMQKYSADLATYSCQKLSALLKQLVENDKTVTKVTEKKKTYFSAC